jgi:tetratricopeptide (TPR) repeat protein
MTAGKIHIRPIQTAIFIASFISLLALSPAFARKKPEPKPDPQAATLQLTTSSPEARQLVEKALAIYLDQVQQTEAIGILHKAINLDPAFAMAHELLAQISLDSAEQLSEQAKAYTYREDVSAPEREAIEWYQDAYDHKLLSAITRMNDLLTQLPHDKTVVWMTTWWLTTQQQYDRSIAIYERSGINDSPGLLNNLAYNYAYVHRFDKAFETMDKYIAALPKDPNPQDSYAEILRMAGRYDASIEHYRASLAIDPEFYSSQFGIADTYALKGEEARARREYEAGFRRFAVPEQQRSLWRIREAATFIREGDFDWADHAFQTIADDAHAHHLSLAEADTYRQMAMYQEDASHALQLLSKAEAAAALGENTNHTAIQQVTAQILRARVEVAIKMGNANVAQSSLDALTKMSDDASDKVIDLAYNGALGAFLVYQQKYAEAIPHLDEDPNNPLSLKLLAIAYGKTGDSAAADRTMELLSSLNDPTLEQALIVPAFRQCAQDPSCGGAVKNASTKVPHTL